MSIISTTPEGLYNITPTYLATNLPEYSTEYQNLREATSFLNHYSIWIIFAFGFPGNIVSLIVIILMSSRRLRTSLFYIALLAVVDNIAIILKIIENQTRYNQVNMDPAACKFLYFLGLTLVAYANWILIVISAERYTTIRFPLKVGLLWSLTRAMIIISVVLLFLCLVHLHIFFSVTSNNGYCSIHPDYASFFDPWWYFISSSMYAFIPAVMITIFNVLIIIVLRSGRNRSVSSGTGHSTVDPQTQTGHSTVDPQTQERQLTIMLFTLAIAFVILTIPTCIFVITWDSWTTEFYVMRHFFRALTSSLANSTHAVNFYLYFASGGHFRNYIVKLCQRGSEIQSERSAGTRNSDMLMVETVT